MFTNAMYRHAIAAVIRVCKRLTAHHSLNKTEHIGPFAGSYLAHSDWDHK